MTKKRHPALLTLCSGYRNTLQWDTCGKCSESVSEGPIHRRADLDFGTRIGDLLIDPWVQDMLRKAHK